MKPILSLRKRRYLAVISIFFTVTTLIAGFVGCEHGSIVEYTLTIASTLGGSVTLPGEGTFTCDEGIVASLVAEAEEGYYFLNWTGDVDTITNVNSATTTITMNGDYSVMANFEEGPLVLYNLSIASTSGGSVIFPGEGTFPHNDGEVVNLATEADEGYYFSHWTGDIDTIADPNDAMTTITMEGNYFIIANFEEYTPMVATGYYHTVGLKSDGTVIAAGRDLEGQCNVNEWTDIIQVAAGSRHTVGLKSDGSVVAVGYNLSGQCNVGDWTDIIQIAAASAFTLGLKDDGTVVAMGDNLYGQRNVGTWTDITQIAAGWHCTIGIKVDGTVVAVGRNDFGQCDLSGWTNIVQVAGGTLNTVGVKSNNTVVAVGDNYFGQADVDDWTNITQVAEGESRTFGLRYNGTLIAIGNDSGHGELNVSSWTNITQVASDYYHTVGLKADGSVVAVGMNNYGQCNIGGWDLD